VTTAVVVQGRVGSTRLPGKILKPLGGHSVLEEVLRRCRAIPGVDIVVCAIPDNFEDDILLPLAKKAGAVAVPGSATDVLARYCAAAEAVKADVLMRVTSDCPLIDPEICGLVLAQRKDWDADYAANNMPFSYPHGLDCEAFTAGALRRADKEATDVYDREHVTPWLRRTPDLKRVAVEGPGGDAVRHRWTLDFPEDYEFLQAVFGLLPPPPAIPRWMDVAAMIEARPDIAAINAMHRVRS
jgi:spore coat polysaccharide biosynthesis protein SpsF